jgi:hypothetical protein
MYPVESEGEECYEDSEYYEPELYNAEEGEEDFLPWEELEEEEDAGVNLDEFRQRAKQRVYQHYVCSVGSRKDPTDALLTEAEMHMLNQDYTQALICALATEMLDEKATIRRCMICTIALYQLGDKKKALTLKDAVLTEEDIDLDELNISTFLSDRFKGTCEVLQMMPDLLNMLKSMPRE